MNPLCPLLDEHGEPDLDEDEEDDEDALEDVQMEVEQAPPSVPIPAPAEPPVKRKRGRPPKNPPKTPPAKPATIAPAGKCVALSSGVESRVQMAFAKSLNVTEQQLGYTTPPTHREDCALS